jgi:hypothetical protein
MKNQGRIYPEDSHIETCKHPHLAPSLVPALAFLFFIVHVIPRLYSTSQYSNTCPEANNASCYLDKSGSVFLGLHVQWCGCCATQGLLNGWMVMNTHAHESQVAAVYHIFFWKMDRTQTV